MIEPAEIDHQELGGAVRPTGSLGLEVIRGDGRHEFAQLVPGQPEPCLTAVPGRHLSLREVARYGGPQRGLPDEVNEWRERNFPRVLRQAVMVGAAVRFARLAGVMTAYGRLSLAVIRGDERRVLDYGIASFRLVTTAGVGFLTDALQNLVEPEIFDFHGIGTTNTAEAIGDTALAAEITTAYNPDNTRATGTPSEPSANVYRSVGTNTVDATVAAVEHGLLTQAATGGGTLLDRSVFSVINLASGDGLQSTYDFTQAAGG